MENRDDLKKYFDDFSDENCPKFSLRVSMTMRARTVTDVFIVNYTSYIGKQVTAAWYHLVAEI